MPNLKFYFIIFFTVFFSTIEAQDFLPKGFAPGEKEAMKEYLEKVVNNTSLSSNAPPGPVRTMAEWEELGGLMITWTQFPEILTEIVRAAREETNVLIVCVSPLTVKNYLTARGVDWSTNVQFVTGNYDSIWSRDYGPNSGYLNNVDSLVIIDWIYNRPRYKDDLVPNLIAGTLSVPIYATNTPPEDLVNTGGNFMVDGLGRGFSSELVLEENGADNNYGQSEHDEAAIDEIMNTYMGLDEYIKMEVLPYDAIHHIDMHMKLLDERTLLVGEYPQGKADGPQIEANLQYVISNFEAAWGREFKVIRMPMPPDDNGRYPDQFGDYRTYTNSVIVNNTILIPTYEEKYDTTALRIWGEAMPGYKLVGIDCNDIIPLSGALHCITKEVGTKDPLQIAHGRLDDVSGNETNDYSVQAIIRHQSGIADAQVFYAINSPTDFVPIEMSLVDAEEDIWEAFIPNQAPLTKIYYYIAANANSGKSQLRPMPAPEGYFDFKVLEMTPTSIQENTLDQQIELLEVYPNPASAITVVPFSLNQKTVLKVELQDISGKVVHEIFKGELPAGDHQQFLMAQHFSAGLYLVTISGEGFRKTQKLVIE